MVKFLHTADWQLGMKAIMLGGAAEKARAIRYDTVRHLLEIAIEKDVDFVLVAGDIFENNGISEEVVGKTCEMLAKSKGIPVYILSGNHDPLTADSVYYRKSWTRQVPSNVKVFDKAEPFKIVDGVILYPCPIKQKLSRIDPTAWITKEDTGTIRIGVAHGVLNTGQAGDNPQFPIAPDRSELAGLDYLALGHWHSFLVHSDGRTVYPGTPEPTEFGERDSGHAVIVEIEKCGATPKVQSIDTAIFKWVDIPADISTSKDIETLVTLLSSVENPSQTVAKVTMKGIVSVDVKQQASSIKVPALAFLKIDDGALYLKPEVDGLLSAMPGNIAKETMLSLLLLLSQHPAHKIEFSMDPEKIDERLQQIRSISDKFKTSPEIVEKAIEYLYILSKGVG